MSTWFEMDYRVDSRDVDLFGQFRPSALLGALQEAATQAAAALGAAAPDIKMKYNAMWMLTRWWVEMDEPLHWADQITIKTWHRGGTGASSYRDFALSRNGVPVGKAVCVWVMVDVDTHKVIPLRKAPELQGTDGGELNWDRKLHRVELPETFDGCGQRELHYSDTDMNGHINNIHYADFACDQLHLERLGRGRFVRQFRICYLSECLAGETVDIHTAVRGDELFALGTAGDGSERFECAMVLADT